jgi:hypothetical protein
MRDLRSFAGRSASRYREPGYKKRDEKLLLAWRFVPAWLDANKMHGEVEAPPSTSLNQLTAQI